MVRNTKKVLLSSEQIMAILNQALDQICEDKNHLYFISDLKVERNKGKLTFQMEWGEITPNK